MSSKTHYSRYKILALSCALACFAAGQARAAVVHQTYSFTIGKFLTVVGTDPSPLKSISGTFTVNYDPSWFYLDDNSAVKLDSLSVVLQSDGTTQTLAPGSEDMLTNIVTPTRSYTVISGLPFAVGLPAGHNNLELGFDLSAPRFLTCAEVGCEPSTALAAAYTFASQPGDVYKATVGSVSAVPLPAGLPLFAGAMVTLGGLGAASKRRRARQTAG